MAFRGVRVKLQNVRVFGDIWRFDGYNLVTICQPSSTGERNVAQEDRAMDF